MAETLAESLARIFDRQRKRMNNGEQVIEVENLAKNYGDLKAVDHVSFNVQPGEIFAFLGPNGAGKTTTVEILECLRPLTSGSARVLGYSVTGKEEKREIKKRIGVLPQDFTGLDRLTVHENVSFFARLYQKAADVDSILEVLGLSEKAKERFENLSGGLKQRVGVAAAMVGDPELLFLDEPTTGLDPEARRHTWSIIKNLRKAGKTIFLTTHYMEEAQHLADRIGVIIKGKVGALGTTDKLLDEYGGRKYLIFKKGGEATATALKASFPDAYQQGEDVSLPFTKTTEVMEALAIISKQNLPSSIEIREPTIEDVFLCLAGHRLTEEGDIA